jgi:hypothetical protein
MAGYHPRMRDAQSDLNRGGYAVIVRGPDGHSRLERFSDVAAYRARLASMEHSQNDSISIEELAGLLDI